MPDGTLWRLQVASAECAEAATVPRHSLADNSEFDHRAGVAPRQRAQLSRRVVGRKVMLDALERSQQLGAPIVVAELDGGRINAEGAETLPKRGVRVGAARTSPSQVCVEAFASKLCG
jgi:hypothetical protein